MAGKSEEPGHTIKRAEDKLPHGGLEVLVDLITHQDMITWTVFSISLAAEFTLLSVFATSTDIRASLYIAALGIVVSIGSYLVTARSIYYMSLYMVLAQKRAHKEDEIIFNIRPPGPSASVLIGLVYTILGAAWGGLLLRILLVVRFQLP